MGALLSSIEIHFLSNGKLISTTMVDPREMRHVRITGYEEVCLSLGPWSYEVLSEVWWSHMLATL